MSTNKIIVIQKERKVIVSKGSIINVSSGTTSSLSSEFVCSEPVLAYQVLAAFGSSVRPADITDITHVENIIGLALSDCAAGESVGVVTTGRVTFAGWNWDDTLPVFLGLNPGEILQDDPEASEGATFSIRLGVVRSPTTIDLTIQQPILY